MADIIPLTNRERKIYLSKLAEQAERCAGRENSSRTLVTRADVGSRIDHDPWPAVPSTDQQVLVAIVFPVAQTRPRLVGQCQHGVGRFGTPQPLEARCLQRALGPSRSSTCLAVDRQFLERVVLNNEHASPLDP